ncbi:MAG: hypothetical protein IBX47_03980 [Desulfuromonadales bacterium]|nr:hypothetical protein [Desulfuromonadales bacterium]
MNRIVILVLCLLLPATLTMAVDEVKEREVKELSGMSIVGNDEAPKSLYIIPWKSSEIGVESRLSRMNDSGAAPIDREVFIRQLEFYETCTAHPSRRN